MTCKRHHDEVSGRDAVIKEKKKSYADNHRHTRHHDRRPGDIVIAKQQRKNKFSLPYDPVPYKVVNAKGLMVLENCGESGRRQRGCIVVKAEDVNVDAPVSGDDAVSVTIVCLKMS